MKIKYLSAVLFAILAFGLVFTGCESAADEVIQEEEEAIQTEVQETETPETPAESTPVATKYETLEADFIYETEERIVIISTKTDGTCTIKITYLSDNSTSTEESSYIKMKDLLLIGDDSYKESLRILQNNRLELYTIDLSKAVVGYGDNLKIDYSDDKLTITGNGVWGQIAIPYDKDIIFDSYIPHAYIWTEFQGFRSSLANEKWGWNDNKVGLFSRNVINLDSEYSYLVLSGYINGNIIIENIYIFYPKIYLPENFTNCTNTDINENWSVTISETSTDAITVLEATENSIKFTLNKDISTIDTFGGPLYENISITNRSYTFEKEKSYKYSFTIKGPQEGEIEVRFWNNDSIFPKTYKYTAEETEIASIPEETTEDYSRGSLVFKPYQKGTYEISNIKIEEVE